MARQTWAWIGAGLGAVALVWGQSASGGALAAQWWTNVPTESGKRVQSEGAVLRLSGAVDGKDVRVCQAKGTALNGSFLYQADWKLEAVSSEKGWQGARAYVELLDGAGVALPGKDGRLQVLQARGDHDWQDLDLLVEPPAAAKQARACVELVGTTAGTLSARRLGIKPLDRSGPGAGKNVLVIVVDTLRADAVGVWGQKLPVSPRMDGFGRQSQVWERSWTQYTWTVPSTISLFNAQYARTHNWDSTFAKVAAGDFTEMPASPDVLAEVLKDKGYLNTSHYANALLKPKIGLNRGFQTWKHGTDDEVATRAAADIARWDSDGMPNFLYAHFMAPHAPLKPSAAAIKAAGLTTPVPDGGFKAYKQSGSTLAEADYNLAYKQAYMAMVYDADVLVGRVLDALKKAGHDDDTLVVLTADHGEMLGEHGHVGHGSFVNEGLTWIPLAVRVPGKAGARIGDRVGQSIDVAPTVLDWLDLEAGQPKTWQGASLLKSGKGGLVVSERDSLTAFIVDGKTKLIEGRAKAEHRNAYDLAADAGEEKPLSASAAAVQALHQQGLGWRSGTPQGTPAGRVAVKQTKTEADETVEQLKALGYVE